MSSRTLLRARLCEIAQMSQSYVPSLRSFCPFYGSLARAWCQGHGVRDKEGDGWAGTALGKALHVWESHLDLILKGRWSF